MPGQAFNYLCILLAIIRYQTFSSNFRLQGPYSKNYLSDRSFTNVNDYEFVDNFATPDTAAQTGKYNQFGWIIIISINRRFNV